MPAAPPWPVLYDAECGLCRTLLAGLLRWDRGDRLRPVALQAPEADELLADLPAAARIESWHLVSPAGERYSGGEALPPLLRLLPGGRAPAAVFARFPRLTDRGYRWVATHRVGLSRLLPARLKRRADHLRIRAAVPPGRAAAPPAR
jgi:predicted DCC family thiol-disulfide oxidoreductase YuxK